ncbi:hypothetical protein FJTKL_00075 [Diaporthe vaccinii]|uniref:Uncharacterized protein n=1 Tax=Diaporthe vaccinii TaxID=105482 RepID=A0ABR4E4N2_9PEZI
MERSAAADYSGLPSPYPSNFGDSRSEGSLSDPSSAQQYTSQSEVRPSGYSTTATPTSEYSGYPASARSGSFPEHHLQRAYHPSGVGGSSMAQTPTSPSMPLQDGRNHQNPQPDHQQIKSDNDVPIDPSIAAPSPTQYAYPPQSPYGQHPQDMAHGYGHQNVYAQPRPDWTGYGQPGAPITPGHHVFPQTPTTASTRPNQVGRVASSLLPLSAGNLFPSCGFPVADGKMRAYFQVLGTDIAYLGLQLCAHTRRAAAQATEATIRGD